MATRQTIEPLAERIESWAVRAGKSRQPRLFMAFGHTHEDEDEQIAALRREHGATDEEIPVIRWIRSDGNGRPATE